MPAKSIRKKVGKPSKNFYIHVAKRDLYQLQQGTVIKNMVSDLD